MGRLNNTEFLTQLTSILEKNNGASSIYVTQKRLSPALDLEEESPSTEGKFTDLSTNVSDITSATENTTKYPILVRISTNGAGSSTKSKSKLKQKISTIVENELLDQFWSDYINVIKNGFTGLKKKEKKKSKKSKVSK